MNEKGFKYCHKSKEDKTLIIIKLAFSKYNLNTKKKHTYKKK